MEDDGRMMRGCLGDGGGAGGFVCSFGRLFVCLSAMELSAMDGAVGRLALSVCRRWSFHGVLGGVSALILLIVWCCCVVVVFCGLLSACAGLE